MSILERNIEEEEYEIDLLRLAGVLWQHIVIIIVTTVLAAGIGFGCARYLVTPMYEAKALMYVNNSSISLGGGALTFSTGELSAAKSLVDMYAVILKTRTTLNTVIQRSGVDYTYEEISKMVSAASENGTQIFSITVKSSDPQEAALIANTVTEVLPNKISDTVEGSRVNVVDRAVVPRHRVSPSYTKWTAIAGLLGLVVCCGVVLLVDMMDDIIRDEEYLTQNYNLPILGSIPDLMSRQDEQSIYGNAEEGKRR